VYAKWQGARDALVDRVQPMLQAAAAAAQQGNQASVITAYLNAKQKHDEALMNLISQSQQNDSQEHQAFLKALAGTAVTHG